MTETARPHASRVDARWFYAFAACFAFTACFHVAAALDHRIDPEAPAWRHLLFVGINLACIAGLLRRPWYFIPPYGLLLVQQLWTHGGSLLRSLAPGQRIDWPSAAVVVVMPLSFTLLVLDVLRVGWGKSRTGSTPQTFTGPANDE